MRKYATAEILFSWTQEPSALSATACLPIQPARGGVVVEDGASRMEILMTVSKFASFCTMVSTRH